MDSGYAHARFRELLYQHGHGYPFWVPEPNDALPTEQKVEGVRIGDVGILTDDGGFEYLWNVHLPADHPHNKFRVPPNFEPLPALDESFDVRKVKNFYPENTAISSANVKKRGIKLEGNIEPGLSGGLAGGGIGVEFSTDGNCGAILTLPRGGSRVDAVKRGVYQQHAARNAKAWYHYLNHDLGRRVQSGSLCLVTGTDKCSSWGVASFANTSASRGFSLKFFVSGTAGSDMSVTNAWATDFGVENRVGVVPASETSQCVFARGFVIAVRDNAWAELVGTQVNVHSISAEGRPSFVEPAHPFARGTVSEPASQGRVGSALFSQKSPAAILADALLEKNADAAYAVVHDDDWIAPMQRGELARSRADHASFHESLKEYAALLSNVVVDNGVCTVVEEGGKANSLSTLGVPAALSFVQKADSENSPPMTDAVVARAEAKTNMFALVIGINKYKDSRNNLNGAAPDADAVSEFLTTKLGVDHTHVRNLRDHEATRAAIITAISALKSDQRIQRGDPILIYYSGHGANTNPPDGWEAGGRNAQIQMIIPHDFVPETTSDFNAQGILDLNLAQLLSQLAQEKGDNITVIFDCCHSGSGTRDPLNLNIRSRGIQLPQGYKILPEVFQDLSLTSRTIATSKSASASLASHVLLAACSQDETAKESGNNPSRGHFTSALLKLLDGVDLRTVTYRDVIVLLDDLPSQHPQCEGENRSRVLFDGRASARTIVLYPFAKAGSRDEPVVLGGGQAQGIAQGAEFDIFASPDINSQTICRLTVSKTFAYSSLLVPLPAAPSSIAVPQQGWALQTAIGSRANLVVALYPAQQLLDVIKIAHDADNVANRPPIQFVDLDTPHELAVRVEDGQAVFVITDQISVAAGLTRLPYTVPINDAASVYAVIESAAHFFYHLRRSNPAAPLAKEVVVEVFELEKKFNGETGDYQKTPREPNLVNADGTVQLKITADEKEGSCPFRAHGSEKEYGFKITSGADYKLFVSAFMFDMSDFTLSSVYGPGYAKKMTDPSILPNGSLTLGYGAGGVDPRMFTVPQETGVDVSYLKIFITSELVDLSHLPRASPFDRNRKAGVKTGAPGKPVWDSLLVAIVQKEA